MQLIDNDLKTARRAAGLVDEYSLGISRLRAHLETPRADLDTQDVDTLTYALWLLYQQERRELSAALTNQQASVARHQCTEVHKLLERAEACLQKSA